MDQIKKTVTAEDLTKEEISNVVTEPADADDDADAGSDAGEVALECDQADLASCENLIRRIEVKEKSHSIIRHSKEEAYPGSVFIVQTSENRFDESGGDKYWQYIYRYMYETESQNLVRKHFFDFSSFLQITDLKVFDKYAFFLFRATNQHQCKDSAVSENDESLFSPSLKSIFLLG